MAKTTGKVFDVTEMSHDDFFDFKLFTNTENWRVDNNKNALKISQTRKINVNLTNLILK